jgi:hypothetical protein
MYPLRTFSVLPWDGGTLLLELPHLARRFGDDALIVEHKIGAAP